MTHEEWKEKYVKVKNDDKENENITVTENKKLKPLDELSNEWYEKLTEEEKEDLKKESSKGIIGLVANTTKLKEVMSDEDYVEYINMLNNNPNKNVIKLYSSYADKLTNLKLVAEGGQYTPSNVSIIFDYAEGLKGINKYNTLAHEYGHFFDYNGSFKNLNYNEIDKLKGLTKLDKIFPQRPSSSDEFLKAVRKDREYIKSIFNSEMKKKLLDTDASMGVQDAITGFFTNGRTIMDWGHTDEYYNQHYSILEKLEKMDRKSYKNELKKIYKELGFDVSNQNDVKLICRQYLASSEIWANIMSAEVCRGEDLEFVKKYLPNSYNMFLKILDNIE